MSDLSRTFAALGDPTRLHLVEHLLQAGEQPAGELTQVTDISAPAVSRHLKVLREAGILTQRVDGSAACIPWPPQRWTRSKPGCATAGRSGKPAWTAWAP